MQMATINILMQNNPVCISMLPAAKFLLALVQTFEKLVHKFPSPMSLFQEHHSDKKSYRCEEKTWWLDRSPRQR